VRSGGWELMAVGCVKKWDGVCAGVESWIPLGFSLVRLDWKATLELFLALKII